MSQSDNLTLQNNVQLTMFSDWPRVRGCMRYKCGTLISVLGRSTYRDEHKCRLSSSSSPTTCLSQRTGQSSYCLSHMGQVFYCTKERTLGIYGYPSSYCSDHGCGAVACYYKNFGWVTSSVQCTGAQPAVGAMINGWGTLPSCATHSSKTTGYANVNTHANM
jgi:hypothetical protein